MSERSETNVEVDRVVSVRAKAGRSFNGAERDQGVITHAVPDAGFPSWEKALCGTKPGARGNGWKDPVDGKITCERCLKQLAH